MLEVTGVGVGGWLALTDALVLAFALGETAERLAFAGPLDPLLLPVCVSPQAM
jgi:hypothetical protein